MSAAGDIIRAAPEEPCRPWPRHALPAEAWAGMAAALAEPAAPDLLALWAEPARVHALLHEPASAAWLLASTEVVAGRYPALSPQRPSAAAFERMIGDLWGHEAAGGRDGRPWLDHGRWPVAAPLSPRPPARPTPAEPADFLPADGEDIHQVALGPVGGGIMEPAHFRLSVLGETVLRLEVRLGWAHKGTLGLMRGKSPRTAARFAARLAGEATVAHSVAFARAAEAASGIDPPPRAAALRAVMAELERVANHLADCGAIAGDAGFAPLPARLVWHREALLRAAAVAFGQRLMMDAVVPGGIATDIAPGGVEAIRRALAALAEELPGLAGALDRSTSLAERLGGVGIVPPALAAAFAAGGVVGRASGRSFDVRRTPGYPPYQAMRFEAPVLAAGDVEARMRVRLAEIGASLALLQSLLGELPAGGVSVPLPQASGEGVGWAEGCRGDIWHWLRLEGGQIAAVFVRDPGWLQWPLLEAAVAGGNLGDVPLTSRSFSCSVSGVDL
jgi:Ni,Fe-hydrogenase III large subunit